MYYQLADEIILRGCKKLTFGICALKIGRFLVSVKRDSRKLFLTSTEIQYKRVKFGMGS